MLPCPALRLAAAIIALLLAPITPPPAIAGETAPLRIFAAVSLTEALQELAADYASTGAAEPRLTFAASPVLARQIEAGAPADIFVSADQEWMDYLEARELIRPASRRDVAGNRLVLIAAAHNTAGIALVQGADIAGALKGGRLACADPDSVPAGRYARAALMSLGIWPSLADRLARAENVRVALAWVARGEAPLGIVYVTDALAEARIRVVDTFPEDSHPPIRYPAAAMRDAATKAEDFLTFLQQPAAQARLHERGFETLLPAADPRR